MSHSPDTPILLVSVQGIALSYLDWAEALTYPTAMIVLLVGTIYLLWRAK